MASRKYLLVAVLIVLVHSVGLAQTDWGWDWKDSSKVAVKNLPQRNEFLNNQYPYPAIPRSQWEVGVSLGNSRILGDVANFKFGYGAGVTVRKALTNMLSIRGGLLYQKTAGIDATLSTNALSDGYISGNQYRAITGYGIYGQYRPDNTNQLLKVFVPNYQNTNITATVDVVLSLNTLSHYRGNPKWDVYVFGGYALAISSVKTRMTDSSGNPFNFTTINYSGSKATVQEAVNAALTAAGAKYQTAPTRVRRTDVGSGSSLITHSLTYGAGVSYKLNEKYNVGIEDRLINTFNGDQDALNTGRSDIFNYLSMHLNINLSIKKGKRVQPLWWINPNNFVYSELNAPKHMKMPKVVLLDSDKDGVIDQFDLEPNTPKGAPVDSHGVAKDTDGDGVPDYRDKELLTPQKCFPVDADGVGTCPEPPCCKEMKDLIANMKPVEKAPECTIGNLVSVHFVGNAKLTKDAQAFLAEAAIKIKANPACKIKVIGYGTASKSAQQLSWERVNAVVKYLVEKQGVSESRLLFVYAQDGDANTVDLQGTTEDGPNTVPAPHPNLKSKN